MILTFEPSGTRSTTTSAVIIFVSEAIGRTLVGSRRQSTLPVSRSNTTADLGGFLKSIWIGSTALSRRMASGEGAVPPLTSGVVEESSSAPVPAGVRACGDSPPSRNRNR